jgi:signal transduction histidine kinase
MKSTSTPYLTDWLSILLRWLVLLGVVGVMAAENQYDIGVMLAVVVLALWNIYVSFLALMNRRMPGHRTINIGVDFVMAGVIFLLGGKGFSWVGLLPLFSSAVYYEWQGSLLVGLGFTLLQGAATLVDYLMSGIFTPAPLVLAALINIAGGLVLGILGQAIMVPLRRVYQQQAHYQRDLERRAQTLEHERMQAFYHMIETLSATLNYQVVLDTALDMVAELLGEQSLTERLVSAVLLFGDRDLRVGAARHFSPTDLRRNFPALSGVLQEVVMNGNLRVISDPANDPELRMIVAIQSCTTALVMPLRRGLNSFGVMLFAHQTPDFFNTERVEQLEMLSNQAVIGIQNARLYKDLELEKERIMETQDEARKKLARDLHDGPTQSVAAIAMRLNVIKRGVETNPKETVEEISKVEDMARRTTQEIRHMLFTLRPLVLESEGLRAALQAIADKMHDTFQQNISLDVDESVVEQLEMSRQTVIFYLVEEALNNARKHAKASKIQVSLRTLPRESEIALLEILDNGVGFNVADVTASYQNRGSLGMVNLRERSEMIGAQLRLDSTPGKGTRVQVFIPLTESAADRLQGG